jgi:hypothetical protein
MNGNCRVLLALVIRVSNSRRGVNIFFQFLSFASNSHIFLSIVLHNGRRFVFFFLSFPSIKLLDHPMNNTFSSSD